jgi:LysM repeat protein
MAHHSPARWLAPIALVVFFFALVVVLGAGGGGGSDEAAAPAGSSAKTETTQTAKPKASKTPKAKTTYVVKLGDTPSQIAAETGVSLAQIQRLNPDLDPQLLAPGQEIRLR